MRVATRFSAPFLLLAVVLAACGSGVNPNHAAIVNGEAIPVSTVEARFQTLSENPDFADRLADDPDGTFAEQVQASLLSDLVIARLWRQAAADLGIEISDEDLAERRDQLVEEVGGEEAFAQLVERSGLSEGEIDEEIRNLVIQERVQERVTADVDVTDRDVEDFYEEQREQRYDQVTARHILVDSEEEALDVLARLEEGEDFAALAEEVSTDQGSGARGGDLGEFGRGRMVPEFEEAAFGADVGEIVGPVESQFGFHVIEVTDRTQQTLADVADDIHAELRGGRENQAMQAWFEELLAEAGIVVNPRFGRWDPQAGRVVPEDVLGDAEGAPADVELDIEG